MLVSGFYMLDSTVSVVKKEPHDYHNCSNFKASILGICVTRVGIYPVFIKLDE